MNTVLRPQGKAMYVASASDKEWLLSVQRNLYAQSWKDPNYIFRKLWGFVTDPRNLRCSLQRVARNKGARTSGVDGVTVRMLLENGIDDFVFSLRQELRSRKFDPGPTRRVFIPKAGKPGEFRPLGIPTVKSRVVEAAVKNILEPIFEADFYPSSFGFRPGKSVHGALEQISKLLRSGKLKKSPADNPRLTYQCAIEGDIKGCFDNISHHGLMNRIRRRIGDNRLNRLVVTFLKAGVMSEGRFLRTETGTPQGGILSPLLANIALSVIDERYERYAWPRHTPKTLNDKKRITRRMSMNRRNDKNAGKPVFVPVRYADDFVILVFAPRGPKRMERAKEIAEQEKAELSKLLKETLNLELSKPKTLITEVTKPIRFLGYHFRVQRHPVWGWVSKITIPKDRSRRLRERIKIIFKRNTCNQPLERRLRKLNPVIRGWGYFYCHAWGAKSVFAQLDAHVWRTIYRWLRKKHPRTGYRKLAKRYGYRLPGKRSIRWCGGIIAPFNLVSIPVRRYRAYYWDTRPAYVSTSMENPVHSERCTPGLEEGASKTAE